MPSSRLRQREIVDARHSDYWGWKQDTLDRAKMANREVREFLGLGGLLPRELPARSLVPGDGGGA